MIERQKEQQRERRLYCIFNAPQVKRVPYIVSSRQQQTLLWPVTEASQVTLASLFFG
jgi:hypothetical protein